MRIAFVHPDLGIGVLNLPYILEILTQFDTGGAERLVVDAALGLQGLGHSVDLYTSYHDPQHCFDETRDGICFLFHLFVGLFTCTL